MAPRVTDGVVHTTACVSSRRARGVQRVSASGPPAGGDLLDDQRRILMPDLAVDQSAHLMCDVLLVPPVDLSDGHHAFQDAAVLGAVNARRQHSPAPPARSARPSGIDAACAQRRFSSCVMTFDRGVFRAAGTGVATKAVTTIGRLKGVGTWKINQPECRLRCSHLAAPQPQPPRSRRASL